jgi:K(+)-stimulated pyrophosphate-energized sodium pump
MAVGMKASGHGGLTLALAALFLIVNLVFVYRSFYCMRIDVAVPKDNGAVLPLDASKEAA